MRKSIVIFTVFVVSLCWVPYLFSKSSTYKDAEKLMSGGQYQAAADLLLPEVQSGSASSKTQILYGKALDQMTESINTDAEMQCYRRAGAPRNPKCMDRYAEKLNQKYGAGAFQYDHSIITIRYTGAHFQSAASGATSQRDAAEADYNSLTKNLIGHPSEVLPRIENFLKKYPSGKWNRKGMLLLARVNEDIWWVHRKWAWLLYNWEISDEDLIVQGEKYRQEAMRLFKKVRGGSEGKAAKRELKLLKKYQSDGKLYGIVNESDISGVKLQPGKKQAE